MSLFLHESDVFCFVRARQSNNSQSLRPIGEIIEKDEWNGVSILKEKLVKGFDNPLSVQDVKNVLNYFGVPKNDVQGLEMIVISGTGPLSDELDAKWAFGAYQVIWELKKERDVSGKIYKVNVPTENRVMLWAQKKDLIEFEIDGEMKQGYYYRVQPTVQGQQVDRYLSTKALRREMLGDTILHEIGHHVDIWHYGHIVKTDTDRAKAETFAEQYSATLSKGKIQQQAFEDILNGTYKVTTQEQVPQGKEVAVQPQAADSEATNSETTKQSQT